MPSFVTHLESAIDGTRLEARTLQTTHAGRPLWVRYDLDAIRSSVARSELAVRPPSMWRYRELLPFEEPEHLVTLGEATTPLLPCPRLGERLGLSQLFIKDESRLPTGSFKARGMTMAVTMAKSLGVKRFAVPTAGNAGGALAAYAARAGLPAVILMPEDTPVVNRYEAALHGAAAFLVDGLINDCGRLVKEGVDRFGWFNVSTLAEPYRIEGKKTMGLELAEQMEWRLPHAVFYPTGGGTGLIGMHKAFHELDAIDWLETDRKPKLFSCQSSGCAPIADAFTNGERFSKPPEDPHTIASGLRVPTPLGDFMILDAVRESGGAAVAVDEDALDHWMRLTCALEGISLCPESAACVGAALEAVKEGTIDADEPVVIFNTGAAQKYIEAIETDLPRLSKEDVDWGSVEAALDRRD